MRFWVVALGGVLLGAIGIGLEVARVISKDNNGVSPLSSILCAVLIRYTTKGFYVPEKNVFSFASIQFLTVSVQDLPFGRR